VKFSLLSKFPLYAGRSVKVSADDGPFFEILEKYAGQRLFRRTLRTVRLLRRGRRSSSNNRPAEKKAGAERCPEESAALCNLNKRIYVCHE
jgi:hypothetical protein